MKQLKLFTIALLATLSMSAMAETIFSFTVTSETTAAGTYSATGGSAVCAKGMATGGSNEITVGSQTFYKFNSSSAWTFTLADNTFSAGDVITFTCACTTSNKTGKGIKINNTISVTGDFPANSTNTISYTVVTDDGIAGTSSFTITRNDSDIKFGTVEVTREGSAATNDATLRSVKVNGDAITIADVMDVELPYGTTAIPVVEATPTSNKATAKVTQATALPGLATILVTAEDETTTKTYTINFTIGAFKCGEIIKATHSSKNSATIEGTIGGTADKNTQDDSKLGKNGHYFGIKLASGNFMAGDVVTFTALKLNGGNTATIYSDKGTTLLAEVPFDTITLTATYILSSTAEWVYLYRITSDCNPNLESISVNRACEADIASFVIAGITAEIDRTAMTITAELPYGTVLTDEDWNNAYVLAGPATTATYTITDGKHTAITVGEKTYTLNITIAAAQSSNNNLAGVTVNGKNATLDEYGNYNFELPYGTTDTPEVVATAEDPTAKVILGEFTIIEDMWTMTITVIAQNGDEKNYTLNIYIADAQKDLLEVLFSNGAKGAIYPESGMINVPYLSEESVPSFVSATFADWVKDATYESTSNGLITKGADGKDREYSFQFWGITPVEIEFSNELVFDSTETFIFAPYGWDSSKGWKFAKKVEESSNKRVSEGRSRIYFAIPAADTLLLVSGSGGERAIKVYVNNTELTDITSTASKTNAISIPLDNTKSNFIAIESNQTAGDGGFTAMTVIKKAQDDGIESLFVDKQVQKIFHNGEILIIRDGKCFNMLGTQIK